MPVNERSFPVELAAKSLRHYLATGSLLDVPVNLPAKWQTRAGVFVSLKKQGQLRGCIGTFQPVQSNIAAEIIHNAVSAGTQDPRFPAVTEQELDEISFSVDILEPPEAIRSLAELEPQKYGVIVSSGHRRGLLLPMLPGVDTVEEQVAIAKDKAGIGQQEPVQLYRFTVARYT
ncbi:hypothetical protein P22_1259 [Propionispora sp. 2/2-37]|uniref:AmmeMemoRadiSam system protein A n=1 Tax=Propionispora sp. 2/2-37 TaxID=1677858 RepID=UPI0006BB7BA3|nr:AmmeMemoRadiSam system protein A [Propionispora sp. 2/2-37]CUH95189.1 hypothetical protein P22_1259 [Propionispora sp. 2/2-37]